MIIDVRYVSSDNNLFEGLITESIEEIIGMENNFFQNTYNQDSIKAEKEGSLKLGEEFFRENEEIKSFNLKNDFGSIEVQGSQNQEINIDYILKVHGKDKAAAEEFIQDLEIIYNLDGENLEISLNHSQTETPELINVVEIDYKITIPERLQTDLTNKYGKLQVQDLKAEVKAANRYGSSMINNIENKVELDLAYGEAEIYNLNSTLDLKSSYAENTIKNIVGKFNLESSYGFNKISNLEADLKMNSRYGGAEITSTRNIDLNSRYTGFTISDVQGKLKADSEYGEFKLSEIEDLELELRYADVEIRRLKDYELYSYDLKVEYGNIDADLGGVSYDNQEQLKYQGQQAEYEIKINSEYGDINIK
jgi:hypothetical protein